MLGYQSAELFRFGIESLAKRLRVAGVPFPKTKPTRLPTLDAEPVFPERELTPIQRMLRPMRDQLKPELVFQGLPMAFNPDAAKNLRANYGFDITGEGGGTWTVRIADGTCSVVDGSDGDVDWRLELDANTWIDISTGELMGQEAFMLGRVTVEGDPTVGIRFDEIFTPQA